MSVITGGNQTKTRRGVPVAGTYAPINALPKPARRGLPVAEAAAQAVAQREAEQLGLLADAENAAAEVESRTVEVTGAEPVPGDVEVAGPSPAQEDAVEEQRRDGSDIPQTPSPLDSDRTSTD